MRPLMFEGVLCTGFNGGCVPLRIEEELWFWVYNKQS